MNASPDFLPPILDLSGSWDDILALLYSLFSRDFKSGAVFHRGRRVIYDGRILADGRAMEEGFWHAVSRGDLRTGERLIDFRRAERLPWAKPLMESQERPEIIVFLHREGQRDKGVRIYIWLHGYDYVLILQTRKKAYHWV